MKFLVIGHARHGKDTLGLILSSFGLKYTSSSFYALKYVYPALKHTHQYHSPEECFNDRHNHRSEWFNIIADLNKSDQAFLCKNIIRDYDVYVGMRSRMEFEASKHLFDAIVWVDASKRLPLESSSSFELVKEDAGFIIDNNSSEKDFKSRAFTFADSLLGRKKFTPTHVVSV